MARSIKGNPKVLSNFEEVSRHIAASIDDDVPHPDQFAIRRFIQQYIQAHREDFEDKGEGRYIFHGGDGAKTDSGIIESDD